MSANKNHMEAVYQILIGDLAVTTLVGSKIYPVSEPQSEGYPVVIYSQLDDDKIVTKDGPIDNGKRFSLEIYSETYTEAQAVGKACKDLLGWYTGTVDAVSYRIVYDDQQDLQKEENTETFGIVQDYRLRIL